MIPATTYATVILLAALSGITTLIGVWLAFLVRGSKRRIATGLGFATGIMLALSFFELLPEAVNATNLLSALSTLVLSFLLILALHYTIPHTHLIEGREKLGRLVRMAFLVAFGLILHDFPEGFAMAMAIF